MGPIVAMLNAPFCRRWKEPGESGHTADEPCAYMSSHLGDDWAASLRLIGDEERPAPRRAGPTARRGRRIFSEAYTSARRRCTRRSAGARSRGAPGPCEAALTRRDFERTRFEIGSTRIDFERTRFERRSTRFEIGST